MNDSAAEDELFSSWSSFSRYPAMLGGTVAGQLVGIAIDAGVGIAQPLGSARVQRGARGAGRGALRRIARRAAARPPAVRPRVVDVLARARGRFGAAPRLDGGFARGGGLRRGRLLLPDAASRGRRARRLRGRNGGPRGADDRPRDEASMMATLLGALRLALAAIARNKMRAALTVLGIFIGITAVVIVTAASTSATDSIANAIDSVGRQRPLRVGRNPRRPRARGPRPQAGSPKPTGGRSRARRSACPASPRGSQRRVRSSMATRTGRRPSSGRGSRSFRSADTRSQTARAGRRATRSSRRRCASSARRSPRTCSGPPIPSVARSASDARRTR